MVEKLTVGEIRGFVATEIAKLPELQTQIEEQTLLDLQDIVDNADDLLAEDKKLAEEEREHLRKLLEEDAALLAALSKVAVNPLFDTSKETPGNTGGAASSLV